MPSARSRQPRLGTVWCQTLRFPPLPEVPEPVRGRAFTGVALVHLGSREEVELLLAPLGSVPDLVLDCLGELSVGALVAEAGADSGNPLMMVQLRHLGGAFSEAPADGGCVGAIPDQYLLFAAGVPASPALAEAISASTRHLG